MKRCAAILLALMLTGCINTHGVMLYEAAASVVCIRFGLMKFKTTRGLGLKFEGLGLDGTCRPMRIKAYRPIEEQ